MYPIRVCRAAAPITLLQALELVQVWVPVRVPVWVPVRVAPLLWSAGEELRPPSACHGGPALRPRSTAAVLATRLLLAHLASPGLHSAATTRCCVACSVGRWSRRSCSQRCWTTRWTLTGP